MLLKTYSVKSCNKYQWLVANNGIGPRLLLKLFIILFFIFKDHFHFIWVSDVIFCSTYHFNEKSELP
jgi:hypothetical protein